MKQNKEMEDDREWRTTLILNLKMKKIRWDKNLLIEIIVLQVKKSFSKNRCVNYLSSLN